MVYLCTVHFAKSEYLIQASGDWSELCGDIRLVTICSVRSTFARQCLGALSITLALTSTSRRAGMKGSLKNFLSQLSTVRLVNWAQDLNTGTGRRSTRISGSLDSHMARTVPWYKSSFPHSPQEVSFHEKLGCEDILQKMIMRPLIAFQQCKPQILLDRRNTCCAQGILGEMYNQDVPHANSTYIWHRDEIAFLWDDIRIHEMTNVGARITSFGTFRHLEKPYMYDCSEIFWHWFCQPLSEIWRVESSK